MISKGLKYPFQDEEWIKKWFIGSFLVIGTILIVPGFTLVGYLLRVMREDSMPEFDDIVDMTSDGIQATLVVLGYIALPITFITLFEDTVMLLGASLLFLYTYFFYSIFYELANNGMRAAFSLQVFRNAFTLDYFIGFIAVFIISNIMTILSFFLLILILTALLLPPFYFYQYTFSFRIMAEAIESE